MTNIIQHMICILYLVHTLTYIAKGIYVQKTKISLSDTAVMIQKL